jgi:anti-anti-sigma factor
MVSESLGKSEAPLSTNKSGVGSADDGRKPATNEKRFEGRPVRKNVVTIRGRINVDNSGEMRRTLSNALRQKPENVTVDLSGVTYIDTSGLATLVEAARIAREQGAQLVLCGIQGQARYFLEITSLDQLFEIAREEVSA